MLCALLLLCSFLLSSPRIPEQTTLPEEGMVITNRPYHTLEELDKTYAQMMPVHYTPLPARWRFLPHTHRILQKGGHLTAVSLGDSIINDTYASGWPLLVQRDYPRVNLDAWNVVRGSTGCWWYRENNRVERYVLDKKPDLVLIGGISHHEDIEAIRDVVRQVRAGSKAEILLMTGPFGYTDPNAANWHEEMEPAEDTYRAKLKRFAAELHVGFLDMEGAWGAYVRTSGKEVSYFKRDVVHSNEIGQQILGRILERFFLDKTK